MKKASWKKKITAACQEVGTYRPAFDAVIDTLSEILERRDGANEIFEKTGGNVIVTHTNKGGAKNIAQHPALRLAADLNRDALAYWRDLGLTPSGLRKLSSEVVQDKGSDGLEKILAKLAE